MCWGNLPIGGPNGGPCVGRRSKVDFWPQPGQLLHPLTRQVVQLQGCFRRPHPRQAWGGGHVSRVCALGREQTQHTSDRADIVCNPQGTTGEQYVEWIVGQTCLTLPTQQCSICRPLAAHSLTRLEGPTSPRSPGSTAL